MTIAMLRRGAGALLTAALTATLVACGSSAAPGDTAAPRTVVDTAGRTVTVPAKIDRIATVGLVPPNNSIVFALGEGPKIVNGPPGGYSETYANYKFLAPNLVSAPAVEGAINDPVNGEALLNLKPDLVVASDAKMADIVAGLGVPTVVISPTTPDGIKKSVTLLGDVLDKQVLAAKYVGYFDDALARLDRIGKTVPNTGSPTLLYLSVSNPMRRPSRTVDWASEMLGAAPVTAANTADGWYQFGVEQVLAWNPQVVVALYPSDKKALQTDPRFADLAAVKAGAIYVTPTGAQLWTQTTSENPLGILWLAKTLRPEQTRDLDMAAETKAFYSAFFGITLTDEQVATMLAPTS